MKLKHALTALALICSCPAVAQADDLDDQMIVAGGAWHAASVPCAAGTVTSVTPRLGTAGQTTFTARDFELTGVSVSIALPSKPRFLTNHAFSSAGVVHYQNSAGNALMQRARPGDSVQVCLVSFPVPTHDPKTGAVVCDPDRDPRGYVFRVYSYRLHAAFLGPSSQHGCGGA